jgi:hypothetical protein
MSPEAIEAVVLTGAQALKLVGLVVDYIGGDKETALHFAAQQLPALLATPKDELTDYEANRKKVLGEG